MHALENIDFLFHLFSHLHLTHRPVFFYLFVDDFSEFTLIENAILSCPLTLLLLLLFFSPSLLRTNRNSFTMFVWHER